MRFYRRLGKRVLDVCTAAVVMLVFTPLFVLLVVLVRTRLGSPVLFRQERPGQKGRPFTMVKFRTMTEARDADGVALQDSERLTSFGRFLRSSSADELPELWNVLKGQMSLVGPRPLLMHYLPRYGPEQARRHEVKPGITGWAQVNGRNGIGWEEKFSLDTWYVDNLSFVLDMKILWLTIVKTIRRENITPHGKATMEEFLGSP